MIHKEVPESPPVPVTPQSNIDGFRIALAQLGRLTAAPSWRVEYDATSDTLVLRIGEDRPSVSYYAPADPLFMLRLDMTNANLTGIDMMHFKSHLVKKYPALRRYLPRNPIFKFFVKHTEPLLEIPVAREMIEIAEKTKYA